MSMQSMEQMNKALKEADQTRLAKSGSEVDRINNFHCNISELRDAGQA